ncbi:MAG: hypothetical protein AAGE76_16140 [Pseudomonadota bacterium]
MVYNVRGETTAAELLKLERLRKGLREFAEADGIYAQPEQVYDPDRLGIDAKNVRMLRKMREVAKNKVLPWELEEFILAKPEVVQVAVPPTRTERFGFIAAIVSAIVLAPLAVLAGLLAVANPEFTGYKNEFFVVAFTDHLLWHATQGEIFGFVAAFAALITFSLKNAVMLRFFAVVSDIFFISFGIGAGLVPVVLLHMILLPVNINYLSRALHNWGARPWGNIRQDRAT